MKRLGVCVLYDAHGIVDGYVFKLIQSMQLMLERLFIVVNGSMREEFLEIIKSYTQDIVIRDNCGMDGGAYKDIFTNYVTQDSLQEYDEVVLFNDTFYGPFFPLTEIWKKADREEGDFWGITRHPEGEFPDGSKFISHIQSYFLVIRKSLLQTPCFMEFWKAISGNAINVEDVIKGFEIQFTSFFQEAGYRGFSLMERDEHFPEMKYNENPCMTHCSELIKRGISPFLKRKSFIIENEGFTDAFQACEYVRKHLQYPISLIEQNIRRLCRIHAWPSVWNYLDLEEFCKRHKKIYIYGKGLFGNQISQYFDYKGFKNYAFVVTEINGESQENTLCYSEVSFRHGDGIILAMSRKNAVQVYQNIKGKFGDSQLFVSLDLRILIIQTKADRQV